MEWKAFGFRISQLNEQVTIAAESAAVIQPNRVKGFPSGGGFEYYDLARADVVRDWYNGGWNYEWRVQYNRQDFTPEVIEYLVNEVGFKREWFEEFYAEFPLEKYMPAEDYFGHPMHFGFRVRTDLCDSLVTTGGAVEVNQYGVANMPYWREAFFGYTLPVITTFNFAITSSAFRVEDIGTPFDDHDHAYMAYPKIGVATGCDTFVENHLGNGDFWVEMIGGQIFYPTQNPSYPSGWIEITDSRRLRTVTVDGVRYYYVWASQDINDLQWGRCEDLTLRYKFRNVKLERPTVQLDATSIVVKNIRAPLTYEIAVDVDSIQTANAWEPTSAEASAVYNAIVSAEREIPKDTFFQIAMWSNPVAVGTTSNGRIVLPSGKESGVIVDVDAFTSGVTASDLNAMVGEWLAVAPWAMGYVYKVIVSSAVCEWTRTDKHSLVFSGYLYGVDVRFPGEEGTTLPSDGTIGAEAFVTKIGGNPSAPGSIGGEIVVDPSNLRFNSPNGNSDDFALSWEIKYTK